MAVSRTVNQGSARAGRDIIAGDQVIHQHNVPAVKATIVDQLLAKLQQELENSEKVQTIIDQLHRYYEKVSHDGVVGLEEKLKKANRHYQLPNALEKKELFAKLLEKWSMYVSAQDIFVFLLARAEHQFTSHVLPQIETLTEVQLNDAVTNRIIEPIVADCGASVFKLDHGIAMGMLYWLAEQCFIRWHK